jgi:hypothetical protein
MIDPKQVDIGRAVIFTGIESGLYPTPDMPLHRNN